MQSPALVTAHKDAALAMRRAAASFWTRFRSTDREISTCLVISGAVHLAALLIFGSALYSAGEDDENIPQLSVQLVTRPGPSSEESTDAALPRPAPDPVEDVLDDPGTGEQTLDAPALADLVPQQQLTPDATASRNRRTAASRSLGGPNTPGPVSCMAP